MSTPSDSLRLLGQTETAIKLAERLVANRQALCNYIAACNERPDISKESLLILKDILEILISKG